MIIEREINGEIKQIELTEKEIYSAYLEQQHIYDRQIIVRALEYYLNDGADKEFYEKYEIPFNEVYQNDEVIDEIAHEMRKNQDKYDMSWEAARDDAFKDVLYEYKEKYSMRAVPKDKIMIAVLDDSYYAENGSYPDGFDSDLLHQSFVFETPEEFIKKWYEINDGAWYWVFDKGEEICSGAVDPGDIEIFEDYFKKNLSNDFPYLSQCDDFSIIKNSFSYEMLEKIEKNIRLWEETDLIEVNKDTLEISHKNGEEIFKGALIWYAGLTDTANFVSDYGDISLPNRITITAATLAVDTDALYEDKAWLTDTISEYLSDTYGYCTSGFSFEVVYNEINEPSETIVTDIQWDVDKEIEESSEEVFEKHILSQLTEKGFDVSQIKLEIIEFKDNDHKDCSWYGGAVAEVKYKDYLFSLEARGDINCTLFDKNENELGYVKDRNNTGRFCSEMAHCLANDTELYEAKKDGRLVFENNNWFEIFVLSPDKEWQTMTWLSESDDIEECVFEMIETMDEMIEELNERKQEKNSVEKSLKEDVAKATAMSAANSTNKEKDTELTIEK